MACRRAISESTSASAPAPGLRGSTSICLKAEQLFNSTLHGGHAEGIKFLAERGESLAVSKAGIDFASLGVLPRASQRQARPHHLCGRPRDLATPTVDGVIW